MEIGSTNTFTPPVQQVRSRTDGPAPISPEQAQINTSNEQTTNAAQEPVNATPNRPATQVTTGAENSAAVTQQSPQEPQDETESSAVREAILSLGEAEPAQTNSELFQERAAGGDAENTRLEPQSITELATSAFEQRQTERTEDRTPEQAELRERFVTGDNNSSAERFVDVNA